MWCSTLFFSPCTKQPFNMWHSQSMSFLSFTHSPPLTPPYTNAFWVPMYAPSSFLKSGCSILLVLAIDIFLLAPPPFTMWHSMLRFYRSRTLLLCLPPILMLFGSLRMPFLPSSKTGCRIWLVLAIDIFPLLLRAGISRRAAGYMNLLHLMLGDRGVGPSSVV
jgi:hypothetical protein